MKMYNDYRLINSPLIKSIPTHWKKLRVKNIVDNNIYYPIGDGDHGSIKPDMYQDNGIPYIRVQNLSWHGEIDISDAVFISNEVQQQNLKSRLVPGDILIAKTGATIGKLGLIPDSILESNTTSSVGKVTVDKTRFSPKYILYCMQSNPFNAQLWIEASQKSAQPGFNIDDLVEFELYSPNLAEQTIIAAFLDYKTTQIDTLIQKKEQLIEKLKEQRQAIINEAVTKGLNPNIKMKYSGFQWLGEIPGHWEVVKTKMITELITDGAHISPDISKEDYPFISTVDLNKGKIDWENCLKTSTDNYNYLVKNGCKPIVGDVLFSKDGTIGKTTIIKEEKDFVVASSLIISRPIHNVVASEYLEFLFRSHIINFQIDSILSGVALRRISLQKFSNLILPLPTKEEQNTFLTLQDSLHKSYLESLEMISLSIEKLKLFRQSIIFEAVTGKIDVRDWKPQTNND